tara:strand:- start:1159 stop:2421 length:1263 start_codon:yes stop_codon:yes gene_type:complete
MSAVSPSKYNRIELQKKGKKSVELKGGVVSVDYYESLYSPTVTANVMYVDAGGNLEDDKNKLTSVKEALPITGLEDLFFNITNETGELKFLKKDAFKVSKAPVMTRESNRQAVLLSVVSPQLKQNNDDPIFDKYKGKISDTVKKILKEKLKISNDKLDIEPTQNGYNFLGKGRGGLDLVLDLCKRSVPVKGDAGFFFYQTKSGFKFKSINELISQKPEFTLVYFGGFKQDNTEDNNDNKIMMPPRFEKDQDVIKSLKGGVYRSRNIFFDPRTFCYEEVTYDISKEGVKKTLGGAPPFADDVKSFTKTFHHILDVGSLDSNPSTEINNDPREWQASSVMRYNLLHSQVVHIQIPCNLKLEAGNVIKMEIESTSANKEEGAKDEQQSGNYLILNLCHHFTDRRSITSLTLVRDTYGIKRSKD